MSSVVFIHAQPQRVSSRLLLVNMNDSMGPVDRYFDLSIGSDLPGTLIGDDIVLAKLKRSHECN